MADSQVPWGVDALAGAVTEPAWQQQAELVPRRHRRPDDPARRAARDGERAGATVAEVPGSHAVYVSKPAAVAEAVRQAAAAAETVN